MNPLSLDCENINKKKVINPFLDLYQVLKKQCLDLLAKNRHFSKLQLNEANAVALGQASPPIAASLSLSDVNFVASHLSTQVAQQVKHLDKNLYILSTTVSLAPFFGIIRHSLRASTTFHRCSHILQAAHIKWY